MQSTTPSVSPTTGRTAPRASEANQTDPARFFRPDQPFAGDRIFRPAIGATRSLTPGRIPDAPSGLNAALAATSSGGTATQRDIPATPIAPQQTFQFVQTGYSSVPYATTLTPAATTRAAPIGTHVYSTTPAAAANPAYLLQTTVPYGASRSIPASFLTSSAQAHTSPVQYAEVAYIPRAYVPPQTYANAPQYSASAFQSLARPQNPYAEMPNSSRQYNYQPQYQPQPQPQPQQHQHQQYQYQNQQQYQQQYHQQQQQQNQYQQESWGQRHQYPQHDDYPPQGVAQSGYYNQPAPFNPYQSTSYGPQPGASNGLLEDPIESTRKIRPPPQNPDYRHGRYEESKPAWSAQEPRPYANYNRFESSPPRRPPGPQGPPPPEKTQQYGGYNYDPWNVKSRISEFPIEAAQTTQQRPQSYDLTNSRPQGYPPADYYGERYGQGQRPGQHQQPNPSRIGQGQQPLNPAQGPQPGVALQSQEAYYSQQQQQNGGYAPQSPSAPTKRALLVGVNYPNTDAELRGCVNDVLVIREIIMEKYNFQAKDITILVDTDPQYQKPTGKNIIAQLKKLVSSCRSGDVVLFHFSGHGSQVPTTDEDEDDHLDEVLVPCDFDVITDNNLKTILGKLPPRVNFTFIADCCHSGTMLDHKSIILQGNKASDEPNTSQKRSFVPPPQGLPRRISSNAIFRNRSTHVLPTRDSGAQAQFTTKGTTRDFGSKILDQGILITGCMPHETSMDAYSKERRQMQGALTNALSLVLSRQPRITYRQLVTEVRSQLFRSNYEQNPCLECKESDADQHFLAPF